MISVEHALQRVLAHCAPRPPITLAVEDALEFVLAEDVTSNIDSPPHDKSLVDGYALRASDVLESARHFKIVEEITAGAIPTRVVTEGAASRVMTGAPIPQGADTVVMIEDTEPIDEDTVRLKQASAKAGSNIMRQGTSLRRGETVVTKDTYIRPIEIGLLSEIGRVEVSVFPQPTVAVVATGNELVLADEMPQVGQIRNSNGPMLCALARRSSAVAVNLGIGRDEPHALHELVTRGLQEDVLVLSGGVSAGVLDLVPSILGQTGVREVFHKVNLKPGKPLWFGVVPSGDVDRLVFGLPGNPVSSLVCFELFVRPALAKLAGRPAVGLCRQSACLAKAHVHKGDRPTYFPAALHPRDSGEHPSVEPLPWQGSADQRTLVAANCLVAFPPGEYTYPAGQIVHVLML